MTGDLSRTATVEVRDRCLCFRAQRAARALARRFDAAFRPFELTNGQFSLMMALNRPKPPAMGEVAAFLAMDRTTLTAALKPLVRRDLVTVSPDDNDVRTRRLTLTEGGRRLLAEALPIWRAEHDKVDAALDALAVALEDGEEADRLRRSLDRLVDAHQPSTSVATEHRNA